MHTKCTNFSLICRCSIAVIISASQAEDMGSTPITCSIHAGIAQLEEQLICNQQVDGSSPPTSFP